MDAYSIVGAGAVDAIKVAVELVRDLQTRVKESGKSELIGQFIDLQSAMMDLQQKQHELVQRLVDLQEENRKLKELTDLRSKMTFNGSIYYIQRADAVGGIWGQYCPKCYDGQGKLAHLQSGRSCGQEANWFCLVCETAYG